MTVYPPVTSLIPHRFGMALLDRLVSVSDDTLCAEARISPDCIFFDATINGVGSWLGIEYMAQAIAAFEGYWSLQRNEEVKVGLLLGSRHYESHCSEFAADSILQIDVHRVLQHENGLGAFDCRIIDASNRRLLAHATVTVFKPDNVQDFLTGSATTDNRLGSGNQ